MDEFRRSFVMSARETPEKFRELTQVKAVQPALGFANPIQQ